MYDNRKILFQVDEFVVVFDGNDTDLPIGVNVDGRDDGSADEWLRPEQAARLAYTLLTALNDAGAEIPAGDFNEDVLALAARHGQTVRFRYAKGSGEVIETRTLNPSEVKEVKSHKLVIGFDPDREEARAYRLDRIKGGVFL